MVRGRRGANTIEFALTAPILFAMLTGMMDLSFSFMLRHAAASAAQYGVRAGASGDDPEADALMAAIERWKSFGLPDTPTITTFRTGTSPDLLVVRVTVEAKPLVGLMPDLGPFEITRLRRVEQP